jgi:hypothetical protein
MVRDGKQEQEQEQEDVNKEAVFETFKLKRKSEPNTSINAAVVPRCERVGGGGGARR